MKSQSVSISLTIALAVTMMLAPFSMDTYLPAFPTIAEDMAVDLQAVSLSVSFYVFALALSQLVGGALSDRFGRRQVLLTGLVLYSIASVGIALSGSLATLLIGRVFQALGAGWVLVSVPALARDRVSGREAAKLFSIMGFITVLAPGIAPSVGSFILNLGTWRYIFAALAVYALFLIPVATQLILKDLPRRGSISVSTTFLDQYKSVLQVGPARQFVLWQASSFSVMMLFITNASFIYQRHYGLSESTFSLYFAANIATMFCFNLINRIMLSRWDPLRILRIASLCQIVGVAALVAISGADLGVHWFLPAIMISIGSMGAISANLQACFLEFFPKNSGSAAALYGATYIGTAGILSAVSTVLPATLLSIVLAMAACTCVSLVLFLRSFQLTKSNQST